MKPLRLSRAPDRDPSLVQPSPEGTKRLCTTLLLWTAAPAALTSVERVPLTARCCCGPSLGQLGSRAARNKGKALNDLWCLRRSSTELSDSGGLSDRPPSPSRVMETTTAVCTWGKER